MNILDLTKAHPASQRPSTIAGGAGAPNPVISGKVLPETAATVPFQGRSVGNEAPRQPNANELHALVAQANEAPVVRSSNLEFSVAEETDIHVVRVTDSETGEVIRQIPSEVMVAIARALTEQSSGTMLEEKA